VSAATRLGLGQPVVQEFVEACSVDVACGSAVGRRGLLRDESDAGVGGETCVAVVGVEVAGEDGEQGGLAAAVRSGDEEPVA
jgi:hypothetical protein